MKNEVIRQRFDALRSQRRTIEQDYQDIEMYVCPQRGEFFQDMMSEHEQRIQRPMIYDNTAIYSSKSLKSHIHGMLISPASKWFGLRFRNDDLNSDQEALEWIEDAEEKTYQALVQSNFNVQTAEFLYDMVTYGMGFIVEEVESEIDWQGIDFKTVGVRESFFETDAKDDLVNYYRRIQWTPLQVLEKFGEHTPKDIQEQAKTSSGVDTKHDIIMCIFKRDNVPEQQTIMPPEKRAYGIKYIRHSDSAMLGEEGGYYEMPAFYAKWDTMSASKFGHSPAMSCLPDIKNVNYFLKIMREQAALSVAPPMASTSRNIQGDLNNRARGLTIVRDLNKLKEMVTGARFDVGNEMLKDFRLSIERSFLMDSLQMKESPAMTATEVQARYDLMMRNISHTLGSLQTNFLDKAVTRTINILYRAGRLLPMPDVVREKMEEFDISYTGPMPRAQKRDDVISARGWIQDTAGISQIQIQAGMEPTSMDIPDFDKIERDLGLQAGVPAKYMRGEEEVQEIRQQRAQAKAEKEKLLKMQEAGKAMQEVGKGAGAVNENEGAAQVLESVQ